MKKDEEPSFNQSLDLAEESSFEELKEQLLIKDLSNNPTFSEIGLLTFQETSITENSSLTPGSYYKPFFSESNSDFLPGILVKNEAENSTIDYDVTPVISMNSPTFVMSQPLSGKAAVSQVASPTSAARSVVSSAPLLGLPQPQVDAGSALIISPPGSEFKTTKKHRLETPLVRKDFYRYCYLLLSCFFPHDSIFLDLRILLS